MGLKKEKFINAEREKFVKSFRKSKIQRLSDIVRYTTRAKITNENVAEHSFYVSIEAMRICNMLKLDSDTKLKVIEAALVHDVPESLSVDVPYNIKKDYPDITEILQDIEVKELSRHIPELEEDYKKYVEHEENKDAVYYIVKLADTISVVQYSYKEIQLGNKTEEMYEIYIDSLSRVNNYINIIEELTGRKFEEGESIG